MSDRIAVFDHGRIAQIGTPAQVYEEPRTEFVAGFVGQANIIARDNRRFALRPEKVELSPRNEPPGGAGWQAARGTIGAAVYAGAITRYAVRLEDGTLLTVTEPNSERLLHGPRLRDGETVAVRWRQSSMVELQEA